MGNTNALSPGIVFWLSILAEHIKNPLLCTLYPGAVYAALFWILYNIIVINVRFGFVLEVATTWGGLLFVVQGKTLSLTLRGGSFFSVLRWVGPTSFPSCALILFFIPFNLFIYFYLFVFYLQVYCLVIVNSLKRMS